MNTPCLNIIPRRLIIIFTEDNEVALLINSINNERDHRKMTTQQQDALMYIAFTVDFIIIASLISALMVFAMHADVISAILGDMVIIALYVILQLLWIAMNRRGVQCDTVKNATCEEIAMEQRL